MKKVSIGKKAKNHINTGGVAVGSTVVNLSANDRELDGGVQITAASANTDFVYAGVKANLTAGTNNDTDGYELAAGATIFIPAAKESDVYLIADAASQQVYFLSH